MSLTHRALVIGVGVGLIGALGAAESARANQLDVTASVGEACTVNPGELTFDEYAPGSEAPLGGLGSFSVTCTPSNTGVTISLDQGENHDGTRRMARNGGGGFLSYTILQPNGFGDEWGEPPFAYVPNGGLSAGETTLNFTGSILQGQNPPSGDYSDLVLISLAYN